MAWIIRVVAKKINFPPQDEMPESVDEAVSYLAETLPVESIDQLKAIAEEDLMDAHFGLGMYLRNHLSLWDGESRIMHDAKLRFGITHADDVSAEIIRLLWKRLLAE